MLRRKAKKCFVEFEIFLCDSHQRLKHELLAEISFETYIQIEI